MPKRRGSPQPSRSPIVMVWSFMVPKSVTTPATLKTRRVVGSRRGNVGKMQLVAADEVMVTDFEIRTGFRLPPE